MPSLPSMIGVLGVSALASCCLPFCIASVSKKHRPPPKTWRCTVSYRPASHRIYILMYIHIRTCIKNYVKCMKIIHVCICIIYNVKCTLHICNMFNSLYILHILHELHTKHVRITYKINEN